MSLKLEILSKIEEQVFKPLMKDKEWKVLVLDHFATKVVSSCCKMSEINDLRITLVEDLFKMRETLPLEAIYIITPTEKSIDKLLGDYVDVPTQYKAAHVFFTEACPQSLLDRIRRSACLHYLKTLAELRLSILAKESIVYSLDLVPAARLFPLSGEAAPPERYQMVERLAEQLATLCATLGEMPTIRYKKTSRNEEFAFLLHKKLLQYQQDETSMGAGQHKDKSVLLILDRSYDPVTPLLHDLTLQSMAYDLLEIEDDVYRYRTNSAIPHNSELFLEEDEYLWYEFRHSHIAKVSEELPNRLKTFLSEKRGRSANSGGNIRDLQQMIKALPQHKKELSAYQSLLNLAEECMRQFNGRRLDTTIKLEQEMVMGTTPQGDTIKDHLNSLLNILMDETVHISDRVRLLLIYLVVKGGITDANLTKIISTVPGLCTDIYKIKQLVKNYEQLGIPIIIPDSWVDSTDSNATKSKQPFMPVNRKQRESEYDLSRWVPYLRDVMEDLIQGKLDKSLYPELPSPATMNSLHPNQITLSESRSFNDLTNLPSSGTPRPAPSARFQSQWHQHVPGVGALSPRPNNRHSRNLSSSSTIDGRESYIEKHVGPRLIICILGGVSYPEIKSAYEINKLCYKSRQFASRSASPGYSSGNHDLHLAAGPPGLTKKKGNKPWNNIKKPLTTSVSEPESFSNQLSASSPVLNEPPLKNAAGINWNWEVLVGGTHVVTPELFLQDLEAMSDPVPSAAYLSGM